MLFSSIQFIVFLPVVVFLYWRLPVRFQKPVLLAASYFFYMSWLPIYGLLLLSLTTANYFVGLLLERKRSRYLLCLSILINVGALCYYKYTNFFLHAINQATRIVFHLTKCPTPVAPPPVLDIILPLGISFFVFEFIHYLVDVYKGDPAIRKPLDFYVFASFFPSQISGPIKRYQDFDKQLNQPKHLTRKDVYEGVGFLLQGLFKKKALADSIARYTTMGVSAAHHLSTVDAWFLMLGFAMQIYFDFSGYTDMGIGSARLLGIRLPNNFNLPYIAARNMIESWQRWHVTLSTWLRDYLFLPLCGPQRSKPRMRIATLLTMLICGLWHGAAWHFMAWGFFHGIILVVTREHMQLIKKSAFLTKVHSHPLADPIAVLGTFILRTSVGTFFFAKTVGDAVCILGKMYCSFSPGAELAHKVMLSPFPVALALYTVYGLLFVEIPWLPLPSLRRLSLILVQRTPVRIALYAASFLAAMAFTTPLVNSFYYFQF
jgi:D-alanyl-lipoteichoic acid acyltransferase DltB (MBOAT superfamily)